MMRNIVMTFCVLATNGFLFTINGFAEANVIDADMQLVTELKNYDYLEPLAVDNGIVWVGHQAYESNDPYLLEAYDQDGTRRIDVALMPHGAMRLNKIGNNTIAVLGRTPHPFEYKLTLATLKNGRIQLRSVEIPDLSPTNAVFHNGEWFGTDLGDGTAFAFDRSHVTIFPKSYSRPDQMFVLSDKLWVLELYDSAPGDEDISLTDSKTGMKSSVFGRNRRNGLRYMIPTPDKKSVIATEFAAKNVFTLDAATQKVTSELSLKDQPYGITSMGSCFVTVNGEAQTMSVLKFTDGKLTLVEDVSIAAAGDRLKFPTQIDYDATHDSLFVKSAYMCPSCSVTQSSVFRAKLPANAASRAQCF